MGDVVNISLVGSANQITFPRQMFIGMREQLSPTHLAASTLQNLATLIPAFMITNFFKLNS